MKERGKIYDAFSYQKNETYFRAPAEKKTGCSIFFDVSRGYIRGFRSVANAASSFGYYAAGYNRKK